jgi:hypothetical protein
MVLIVARRYRTQRRTVVMHVNGFGELLSFFAGNQQYTKQQREEDGVSHGCYFSRHERKNRAVLTTS